MDDLPCTCSENDPDLDCPRHKDAYARWMKQNTKDAVDDARAAVRPLMVNDLAIWNARYEQIWSYVIENEDEYRKILDTLNAGREVDPPGVRALQWNAIMLILAMIARQNAEELLDMK